MRRLWFVASLGFLPLREIVRIVRLIIIRIYPRKGSAHQGSNFSLFPFREALS